MSSAESVPGRADTVEGRLKPPVLELQGCLKAQPMRRSGDPETWVGGIFLDAPEDVDLLTIVSPESRLTEVAHSFLIQMSTFVLLEDAAKATAQRSLRHFRPTFLPSGG